MVDRKTGGTVVHPDSQTLNELHEAVLNQIKELGLVHYPSSLGLGDNSAALLAFWTEDDNWRMFIALASEVGATVVYTGLSVLSAEDIADEENADGTLPESLSSHLGEPVRLSVAYAVGPIVHLWIREASWWQEIDDEQTGLDEEADKQNEAILARAAEAGWARKIAEDPRYYSPTREGPRIDAAYEIVGELLGAEAGEARDVGPVAWRLHEQAEELVEDVRAQVEERALAEVPEMVSQLTAKNPDWYGWAYRVRRPKAKRLVTDRYGMNIAGVTDEVARWSAEKQREALLLRAVQEAWMPRIIGHARYRNAKNEDAQREAIAVVLREILGIPTDADLDLPTTQAANDLLTMSWEHGGAKILG